MKAKLIGMAVVLVSFAIVVGGYAVSAPDVEKKPIDPSGDDPTYMEVDDGAEVYVDAGVFTIGINGNITTGYSWTLVEDSGLELVDSSYETSDTTLVGAPECSCSPSTRRSPESTSWNSSTFVHGRPRNRSRLQRCS